jgi:hypothetical protein
MNGGADWNPEIEAKLRACDIFILLVSAHSMASDYIIDREIAIIRERQAREELVHFYPLLLLLTPTPKAGLDKIRDKNLRPRDATPFSRYQAHDRAQHMTDAADEIEEISKVIARRKRINTQDKVLEYAENAKCKDFTLSGHVRRWRAVEPARREAAKQRQREHGGTAPGRMAKKGGSGGRLREEMERFTGFGGRTLEKAIAIVKAAEQNSAKYGHLVDLMDRNGADGVYKQLRSV